jgi:DNA mismatch endonuclease (patch repair protein)
MQIITSPSFGEFSPASPASSQTKKANRNKDTKHEIILRKELYRLGLRYRKNVKHMPGKPDIVFYGARLVVFCDGDFWHGRNWKILKQKLTKGTNASYWINKIEANIQRDHFTTSLYEKLGWKIMRVWETDIYSDCKRIAKSIAGVVRSRNGTHKRIFFKI